MTEVVTVATIVAGVFDIEIDEEQSINLDLKLKIKSTPRTKMSYKLGNGDAKDTKLAPQAKILLGVLNKEPMSLESWGDAAAKDGMKTTQDPARIAAYYRKTLVDAKLVTEVPAS